MLLLFVFPLFRLVSGNLGRWVWAHTLRVYKVFTKTGRGPWVRGGCLGPAGVINCTPLSALSFCVSLFPRTRLQQYKANLLTLPSFRPVIWFLYPHLPYTGTLPGVHMHPSAKMDLEVKASGRNKTHYGLALCLGF